MTMPLLPGPGDDFDANYPHGPDRRPRGAPLTQREQKVLSRIEDDLADSDPQLAARMRVGGSASGRFALVARCVLAAVVGVVVLVIGPVLLAGAGWALLLLIAATVVLPWLFFWAAERYPWA